MAIRGGKREGAGGKSTWKHGRTKPVRLPISLADKIIEIAKRLDRGDLDQSLIPLSVINLSGIEICHSRFGAVVRLSDLVEAGYQLIPDRLMGLSKIKLSIDQLDLEDLLHLAEEHIND